jgi:antitoxin component YwqK of YwqJK toxin-antitoxin module
LTVSTAGSYDPRVQVATPAQVRRDVTSFVCALVAVCAACSTSSPPDKAGITPTYDKSSGRLTELAYDSNHNGKVDTWTEMDGARPLRSRVDSNEDGLIDRWEFYDDRGKLTKVGFSRQNDGKADAWAFVGADGKPQRVEMSSTADEMKIDRWEHYETGVLTSAEEDTNHDGTPDKWESYEDGSLKSASFDENADGRPDRRLTYLDGALVSIETDRDAGGTFKTRVSVTPH